MTAVLIVAAAWLVIAPAAGLGLGKLVARGNAQHAAWLVAVAAERRDPRRPKRTRVRVQVGRGTPR